jgi:hypothetical protein
LAKAATLNSRCSNPHFLYRTPTHLARALHAGTDTTRPALAVASLQESLESEQHRGHPQWLANNFICAGLQHVNFLLFRKRSCRHDDGLCPRRILSQAPSNGRQLSGPHGIVQDQAFWRLWESPSVVEMRYVGYETDIHAMFCEPPKKHHGHIRLGCSHEDPVGNRRSGRSVCHKPSSETVLYFWTNLQRKPP